MIGADPLHNGVVYLGSERGLWEGLPQSGGTYHWKLNLEVPDTKITAIVPHVNVNGYGGRLRVGTYGRGVWESALVPTNQAAAECLTCAAPPVSLASLGGPSSSTSTSAVVAFRYTYIGEAGPTVRAVPTSNGRDQPFFISEVQSIGIGDGVVPLLLVYASADAPLGLHTDAIRFEILSAGVNGSVLTHSTLPFDHWWLRPEARLLTLNAQSRTSESGQAVLYASVLRAKPVDTVCTIDAYNRIVEVGSSGSPNHLGVRRGDQRPETLTEQTKQLAALAQKVMLARLPLGPPSFAQAA